jgi:hypothetical protein
LLSIPFDKLPCTTFLTQEDFFPCFSYVICIWKSKKGVNFCAKYIPKRLNKRTPKLDVAFLSLKIFWSLPTILGPIPDYSQCSTVGLQVCKDASQASTKNGQKEPLKKPSPQKTSGSSKVYKHNFMRNHLCIVFHLSGLQKFRHNKTNE